MHFEVPEQTWRWVVAAVDGGRDIVSARRLTGGLTARMTAVTVIDRDGRLHRLVLRRWTGESDLLAVDEPANELVRRESAVLAALHDADIAAPRLVAADDTGGAAGAPAVLMTLLPGRMVLAPADVTDYLRQLAETLPRLHALTPATGLAPYKSWLSADVDVPAWTARPDVWRAAIALARAPRPDDPQSGFVHHDYQPFNLLWSKRRDGSQRLSGIVDWTFASHGPPDDDVTHCRLNLVLLHSVDAAEQFRVRYEAASGRRLDPWWDLAGLVDYLDGWSAAELQKQAGRRMRVDAAGMNQRVEDLLVTTMRRVG